MNNATVKIYYKNVQILKTYRSVLGKSIYQMFKENEKRVVTDLKDMGFRCVDCRARLNIKDLKRADLDAWAKCARCSHKVMNFSRFIETVIG